ncbi:uncharacterized protein LOC108261631 isoform X1 [Ictalurus punctatus]|uniref:Uncharacterized protein LOC108261631 isoform X1 n=1 Tax=Ictalurus punctatus TaxID=7998 RepID=A0A9F7RS02_ICTPU|nr:uncharacterized protein LOC108261631 isoform X1 [Ictalurus punctatus]
MTIWCCSAVSSTRRYIQRALSCCAQRKTFSRKQQFARMDDWGVRMPPTLVEYFATICQEAEEYQAVLQKQQDARNYLAFNSPPMFMKDYAMPHQQEGESAVRANTISHPPSPIMDLIQPARSAKDVAPPSCSAEDIAPSSCSVEVVAPPSCSVEVVAPPSCLAEVVAPPSCSAEVVALPSCSAEDVALPSCSAEVVAPPSCSAEVIAPPSCFEEDVALPPCSTEDVIPLFCCVPYVTPPSCSTEDIVPLSCSTENLAPLPGLAGNLAPLYGLAEIFALPSGLAENFAPLSCPAEVVVPLSCHADFALSSRPAGGVAPFFCSAEEAAQSPGSWDILPRGSGPPDGGGACLGAPGVVPWGGFCHVSGNSELQFPSATALHVHDHLHLIHVSVNEHSCVYIATVCTVYLSFVVLDFRVPCHCVLFHAIVVCLVVLVSLVCCVFV